MKFLCDRCKTRYSIGDDRVRGKILKIRCKNCANVITVREGMTDEGGIDPPARGRPTTMSPNPSHTAAAENGSALGAAFAAQLTKPPAALEEEWYVSIDGEQQGPFNLADAQQWVASQAHDADLYCWSEGFDDWLPVDKVSHFRNHRKKPPAPAAPPPLPRVSATRSEETPKPLFAATMASLERGGDSKTGMPMAAGGAAPAAAAKPAAATTPAVAKSVTTPVGGVKANGTAASIPSVAKGTGASQTPMSTAAAALAAAFDASDDDDEPGDSATTVGAPMFGEDAGNGFSKPPVAAAKAPAPAAKAPVANGVKAALEDDDNLEIGEVSRVVNLADIARGASSSRKSMPVPQVGRTTGQTPRYSAQSLGNMRSTGPVAPMPAELGMPMAMPGETPPPDIAAPVVEHAHKRGMIILLAVAGLLLLGVAGAVILMVTSSDDSETLGLGNTTQINTTRPDDITGHRSPLTPNDTQGSAAVVIKTPVKRTCPPFCGTQQITQQPKNPVEDTPTDPNLRKIDASEVEDYANKQNGITQRCFMRAQKGVDGILVGEVKKIFVTLSIDKDGTVSDVQLSEHGNDALGKCLAPAIKRWKFRASPGGTYKFALAFANG